MKYQEIKVGHETIKLQDFQSIQEFTQYLDNGKSNSVFDHEPFSKLSSHTGSRDFSGTQSYQEAQELFQNGWNEVAQKLAQKVPTVTASANVTKSKPAYSVVGGQVSVPRYLQGIPTNMVDRRPVTQKQKIIVANRDICYAANVSKERILEEGIKTLQVVQALENKGFRVKLNLFFISTQDNETVGYRLTVKKPEERLALSKVAFPLAHPGFLRRISFKWMESHPNLVSRRFQYGYGMPAGSKIHQIVGKNEIVIPNFIGDVQEFVDGLKF